MWDSPLMACGRCRTDGTSKVLLGTLEVLHVERLDSALFEFQRLLFPLCDGIHDKLQFLLRAPHVPDQAFRGLRAISYDTFAIEGAQR